VQVVLDSWAVLRYLEDIDPAATAVARLLEEGRPIVSWINVGEVYYVIHRRHGEGEAVGTVRDLQAVTDMEVPDVDRVLEAAKIKADHPMSYADAFAAATAITNNATLWTGDPELMIPSASWRWHDLREP